MVFGVDRQLKEHLGAIQVTCDTFFANFRPLPSCVMCHLVSLAVPPSLSQACHVLFEWPLRGRSIMTSCNFGHFLTLLPPSSGFLSPWYCCHKIIDRLSPKTVTLYLDDPNSKLWLWPLFLRINKNGPLTTWN